MIRYGVSADISAADLELLRASGQVEIIDGEINPADLGGRFDVLAAYGTYPDAQMSPISSGVVLVLNNTQPPLDNPAVLSVVQRALESPQPESTAALRTELANAGWPDGFDIILAHQDVPGVAAVIEALQTLGIESRLQPLETATWDNVHAAMVTTSSTAEYQAWTAQPNTTMINLFAQPISYWTVDGLTITFTPGGWPLAAR